MNYTSSGIEAKKYFHYKGDKVEYQNLRFKYSHTGFVRNVYQSKDNKGYYVLQWDNGYNNKPVLYLATKDGEPQSPVKQNCIEFFIFPEGHEHYGEMLRGQNKKGDSMKSPERKEFLNDVFTIALEGGIGYWSYAEEYHNNSDDYFAVIVDAEGDDAFEKSTINQDTIVKGINKIINLEVKINPDMRLDIIAASKENDASNIDANIADCIVQVGLLGEIVFG